MCSPNDNAVYPVIARAQVTKTCDTVAIVFVLLSVLSPWVVAGDIYKSIDSQGNIVFTDQPLEGAETIKSDADKKNRSNSAQEYSESRDDDQENGVPGGASDTTRFVSPKPVNPSETDTTEPADPNNFLPITRVEILTPSHDTTVQDPLGQIWVELQSYPTPMNKSGLTAQLWMDETLITSDKSTMLRLPPPARGTHVLRVKLVDSKGQLFHESESVHIHVRYRSAEQQLDQ